MNQKFKKVIQKLIREELAAEKLPKDLVKSKYHREGFLENLDEYKAEAVLTPKAQGRAQQLLGSKWRDLKPSAVIRILGKKTATANDSRRQQEATTHDKDIRKFIRESLKSL